jgi:hypothetical protein
MDKNGKRVVLFSINGYSEQHDALLRQLIDEKINLFCAVGKDCKLWEEIVDELFVGEGEERDFELITTSHPDETFDEVIQFAETFHFEGIDNEKIRIIQV